MEIRGVTRKLDDLGRIVIPSEIRKSLDIKIGTELDIYVLENQIILRKINTTTCKNCENRQNDENAIYCKICGERLER